MSIKPEEVVSEKDKPFILAIISAAITILNVITVAIGAHSGNEALTTAGMETLKFSFPLTMMSWTFYFSKE